jgi:hypothetical protein
LEGAAVTAELDTRAEENPGRGCTYALLITLALIIALALVSLFA